MNATEQAQPPEAPEPGAEHAVRLLPKNWAGNNSIFEDVIEARGRGENRGQPWAVPLRPVDC